MGRVALRNWLPGPMRRAGRRARAAFVRSQVAGELQRIAQSGRPVIAGPWLGEVGFEILYWTPFLRWASAAFNLAPDRVLALSRGGVASWYHDVAGRYVDLFDHLTVEEFRAGNERRRAEVGEQKQVRESAFEREILAVARKAEALEDAEVLHPSLMYRLFQPYWWKHEPADWVEARTEYRILPRPELPPSLGMRPGEYIAVKFYCNDCVPDDERTGQFASAAMAALSKVAPVVTLSTDLVLDDHGGTRAAVGGRVASIASLVRPRNNLAVQTAVVANARAFVGTYGGFSYVPPFHGVPTLALYAKADGFDRAHLVMAEHAYRRVHAAPFELRGMADVRADALLRELEWMIG